MQQRFEVYGDEVKPAIGCQDIFSLARLMRAGESKYVEDFTVLVPLGHLGELDEFLFHTVFSSVGALSCNSCW